MLKYVLAVIAIVLVWAIILVLRLPEWIAAIFTLAVIGLLVTLFIMRKMRARKAALDIERALNAQAQAYAQTVRPEQQAEIRQMEQEFSKAIASLKTSKLGGVQGTEALYALPWYMIIGPPGAGKSTALRNSGLQFPYLSASGGGVKGVGGTRNCEWWLTNEAVLLDTAGRYTTEEDDRDEWFSFLDMLKKNRSHKPINGVMVAISVGDLGGSHEDDVQTLAKRVRERIDEVMNRLAMVVPVYIVFTKCDLIPGFVEMFGDLRKNERGQIWGFTVPLAQPIKDPKGLFEERFDELAQVVSQRALRRLAQERRPEVRERVYEFPQQFEVLKNNLADFVGALFAQNVYQGTPNLRGVYFTSGTQEGRPIDRVMSAMAEAFGIRGRVAQPAQPAVEAKSYFLRDVFSNVVFPDQDVAARSAEEIRRERNRRYAIAAGAFGFAALLSALPSYSYFRNRELLRSSAAIASNIAQHRSRANAGPISLESLEPLRQRIAELKDHVDRRPPLPMRFGMYQGDKVLPGMRDMYTATLRRDVFEPIVRQSVQELNTFGQRYAAGTDRPSVDDHQRYYDELKTHLLLTTPSEASQPAYTEPVLASLTTAVVSRWANLLRIQADGPQRQALETNARFYLSLLAADTAHLAMPRNAAAVRITRETLTRTSATDIALEQLIEAVEQEGYGLNLQTIVGGSVTVLRSDARIRGAFTRRGWEEYVRDRLNTSLDQISGEAWVLGRNANDAQAAARRQLQIRQLRSEYFRRYIDEWTSFLASIRVSQPRDLNEALGMLQELTRGAPPPYGAITRALGYNSHLEEPAEQESAAERAAANAFLRTAGQSAIDRLRSRLGVAGQAGQLAGQQYINGRPVATPGATAGEQLFLRRDVETSLIGFWRFGYAPPPAPPPPPAPGASAAPPPPPPSAPPTLPINAYQEQLEFVRDALVTATENPNAPQTALNTALQTARTRVEALIMEQEIGWRPRFRALLWPPIDFTTRAATHAQGAGNADRWCVAVAVPFARRLQNRYPFNPNGYDAALADVQDFYRPENGLLWAFYGEALRTDVPRVGDHFEFGQRLGTGGEEVYLRELPEFLNRSQDISTVLFAPRAERAGMQFEVRIRPTPTVASITFSVDGQDLEYHNGPELWTRMNWPGEGAVRGATIRIRGANGLDETITQDGEWGLFRLLEQGTVRGDPGARVFTTMWTLRDQNLEVAVDFRPARSENPFLGIPRRDGRVQFLAPFRVDHTTAPRVIARNASPCTVDEGGGAAPSRSRRRSRRHHDARLAVSRHTA